MANATIIDVAAQAGVSIKTVSRVINNVTTVKPAIRARVARAIEKLDYHPNPSARGLGGNRSYLLGLLYDLSCEYYATSVLAGVFESCRAANYQVVMQPCDYRSSTVADDVARNVRRSRADGVILTPPLSDQHAIAAVLELCAAMTEQLVALGHQRIGFIIGNPDHAAVADRHRGYLDGLRVCGLRPEASLVSQGYNSHASGMQCARKLLTLPPAKRPSAIFASNDEMAAGVLAVAHSMGIAVPEQLSVVGFDDVPLAKQVWPALTTIRQPIPDMAAKAAQLLLRNLSGQPPDHSEHVLQSSLTFRHSTGPAPNRVRARSSKAPAA